MGSGASSIKKKTKTRPVWKTPLNLAQAKKRYIEDEGSLVFGGDDVENEYALEFRALLDEPLALSILEDFASVEQCEALEDWKRVISKHGSLQSNFYDISSSLAEQGATVSVKQMKNELNVHFQKLYSSLFLEFKNSEEYLALCELLSSRNAVCAHDFDYFTALGAGAFGCIFSCRKQSTGLMYAMKVQPKKLLIQSNRGKRDMVMTEFWASTGCPSPFLCQAAFAFQTPNLVFLALPLYFNGDLRRMLNISSTGYLNRDAVQFITAELSCALFFMHMHGLIHRDVKPENVFIDNNGHVVLGDFGTVSGRYSACLIT